MDPIIEGIDENAARTYNSHIYNSIDLKSIFLLYWQPDLGLNLNGNDLDLDNILDRTSNNPARAAKTAPPSLPPTSPSPSPLSSRPLFSSSGPSPGTTPSTPLTGAQLNSTKALWEEVQHYVQFNISRTNSSPFSDTVWQHQTRDAKAMGDV